MSQKSPLHVGGYNNVTHSRVIRSGYTAVNLKCCCPSHCHHSANCCSSFCRM